MKAIAAVVGILLFNMGGAYAHTLGNTPATNYGMASTFNPMGANNNVSHSRSKIHHQRVRRKAHHLHRKEPSRVRTIAPATMGGLVTVPTAAGISITVATSLANQFQGFIKDLVDEGYTPKQIHCWAPPGTHVPNSNHYHGGACDFDQTGWGQTSPDGDIHTI
jgi:hypothetical protein